MLLFVFIGKYNEFMICNFYFNCDEKVIKYISVYDMW